MLKNSTATEGGEKLSTDLESFFEILFLFLTKLKSDQILITADYCTLKQNTIVNFLLKPIQQGDILISVCIIFSAINVVPHPVEFLLENPEFFNASKHTPPPNWFQLC